MRKPDTEMAMQHPTEEMLRERKMNSPSRSKWKLRFAFGSAIVTLLVVGAASYRAEVVSTESERLVEHTHEVLENLQDLSAAIATAESSNRGFVLTSKESFIESYRASVTRATQDEATVRHLTTDDPMQQRLISALETGVNHKIQRMDFTIGLRRTQGMVATAEVTKNGLGQQLMSEVQGIVREMQNEELRLLALRDAKAKRDSGQTKFVLILGTILGLAISAAAGWSVERDNSARGAAEESLRQSEEVFRMLSEASPVGIFRTDEKAWTLYTNDRLLKITGRTRETSDGYSWREAIHPEDRDRVAALWKNCLERRDEFSSEHRYIKQSGETVWVATHASPLRDPNGGLQGFVGVVQDITALREAQERILESKANAEAANRAKSEFLANMSHEIRTPLNGVVGMTDLVLDTELTSEQREYLETVKISADSLLMVINDILDFSKIEAGKIDLEKIDFDLRDCLETTLKTLALRADEKRVELLCEVAAEVPEGVRGDSSRLRQIVVNLVGNAIKFTDVGEVALKVQVDTAQAGDPFLHFTISDTGIGIPPEKLKSIFDPFTQADTSTTRKYGGTGLGLTISIRLVKVMGGKMWVESQPGKGTKFHFVVPLVTAEEPIQVGTVAPAEVLRGVRVLIVDDNTTNRRILEGMLKRWEMRTTSVEGGEEGITELLEAWEAGDEFGLIISDLLMPKMDGFHFVERIRRKPQIFTAMIMLLTSAGCKGDAQRCEELGVSAYLMKPVRQTELREAIARVLGAQQQKGAIPLITRYALADARNQGAYLRVLLVEDNAVNQRLAARLLQKRGHNVMVAANGREALDILEKGVYDLVLMDLQMPEMDGFEATAVIREKEKHSGTHQSVIALTAHAMKGDRERCLAAGMDGYLSKPIRPEELDDLLQAYVARRMDLTTPSEVTERAK